MTFKLGELFAGPGGLGLGAKLAKTTKDGQAFSISLAWATDYDRDSCKTYIYNICREANYKVLCKDIRKLDLNLLKQISTIDALAFGFPCNDFSVVGEQKGIDGVYGPLYKYGINVLRYFKPKWFLAENVCGLRNSNEGSVFKTILLELYNSGYSVYPHLYKFEDYGIPQTRHRIIIIGIRNDLDTIYNIPSPEPFNNVNNTCKNAIDNPPINQNAPNNELTKQSKTVIERLKHIKPGENAFSADLPANLRLNVNGAKISQIYKRLEPNKPAYTVTGSGGGGTHVYHWEEPRALTNRERARLQTFPDDFIFSGSKESVRKQIGMAVPVQAAKIIFESILNSFAEIKYPKVNPNIKPLIKSEVDNKNGEFFLFENEKEYKVN